MTWTPRLDQAGSYEVPVPQTGDGGAVLRIGVVDRFDAPGNVPPAPARYSAEYGLPVMHLRTQGPLDDATFRPVTFTFRGRTWQAEARIRGQNSSHYPKKGWNLRFPDADRFDAPDLGFDQRKRIALIANFDDPSYVRNRLGYELWRQMDPEHLRVRHASVVVYLDGAYHGLYTLAEKIGGQFLSANGLWNGGNLYEAVTADANFSALTRFGEPKTPLSLGYEKQEGSPQQGEPGAFDDLEAFIRFVVESDDAKFAESLPRLARLPEYQDWWVYVTYAHADDNVRKNNYARSRPAR